jgi:proteic killer suppression protein
MIVYFHTKKLQKACCAEKEAVRTYGPPLARKLMQRLQELAAADNLADIGRVPPPRCHELTGGRAGQLSVDLQHPYRLLFIPANDPVPRLPDGGLDWDRVTEIEIIEIADTHGT